MSARWELPTVDQLQGLLPPYEILALLGRGGMGAVYKGRQKSLNRLVAIKILPDWFGDDEWNFAERFKNEAQTIAQLSHPAIVHVYDFGETTGGLLYFVMEYVDGRDVAAMLASEGRLAVTQAVGITKTVCEALHYAHSRGVIHRDIKPANVLIDGEGQVKVADFGLAKLSDPAQASGLTRTNVAMGTQEFAAPEMLTPGATVDHRADLYSLGVMLYQMLTGEVPRVLFKLPSRCQPELGMGFDALICKALETDPADRFQSALEFRDALAAAASAGLSAATAPTAPGVRRASNKLPWAVAAGLMALAGGGWYLSSGGKPMAAASSAGANSKEATGVPSATAPVPAESFRPLFDGKSLNGWLTLNGASASGYWRVVDGALTGIGYSAVMTREDFGDFDLRLDWRVNPQGNGGIYYRITENAMVDRPLHAIEFNLMDDNISAPPLKQCGAAFDLKAPYEHAAHPAGEWNTARLLVQGTRVEQWINDKLVCSYNLADAAMRDALEHAGIGGGFATVPRGRIALQDWNGEAFYRNVRIRELTGNDAH